jgi:leucyl/phenylalanyl-tRNA--protein transferase
MSVSESTERLHSNLARPTRDADSREISFREARVETAQRWLLGAAWALQPRRIAGIPGLVGACLADLALRPGGLPDPDRALNRPKGLAGQVHDFSPETILEAYRLSLFPFAHCGPLKWWSPAERCVLRFDDFHMAKRLRRQMRQQRYSVTFDSAFDRVIKACAGRREGRWHLTWITPRIMRTFARLSDLGHAHSFEVWNPEGELVGGGYGLAVGRVFFTESQFSLEPNTSKIGFSVLNWHLARWGFSLNDGKEPTPTIDGMGFRPIPRAALRAVLDQPQVRGPGSWSVEADPATVATWQPGAENEAA